jgi:hypothetical protein
MMCSLTPILLVYFTCRVETFSLYRNRFILIFSLLPRKSVCLHLSKKLRFLDTWVFSKNKFRYSIQTFGRNLEGYRIQL